MKETSLVGKEDPLPKASWPALAEAAAVTQPGKVSCVSLGPKQIYIISACEASSMGECENCFMV